MTSLSKYPLSSYLEATSVAAVFRLRAEPQFSPLDVNLAFLARSGWNQSVDRLRFHFQRGLACPAGHPMTDVISRLDPHLLIRRLERDADRFGSVHVSIQGEIVVLSNDAEFARALLQGIFLECPPSFHSLGEFVITEDWQTDGKPRPCSPAC